jgi:accessory gene regulator B
MIERIAKLAVRKLSDSGVIDKTQIDVYIYGADAFVYTLVSTAGLLLTGFALRRSWESLLILFVYYANQTIGGGFHATTHLRCFAVMEFGLIMCLIILNVKIVPCIVYLLIVFSIIILFGIPIVLHPNKDYLEDQRYILKKRSRIITATHIPVAVLLAMLSSGLLMPFSLGATASAISRAVGYAMRERH